MAYDQNRCCKCIFEIKKRLVELYQRINDGAIVDINPYIERINAVSKKIYDDISAKLEPIIDRLKNMYDRINADLINRVNDTYGRSAPICSGADCGEFELPRKYDMQKYWDELKPPPYLSPEYESNVEQKLDTQPDSLNKPQLVPDSTRQSESRLPGYPTTAPKPMVEKECPPFYGLTCCPENEIQWFIKNGMKGIQDIMKMGQPMDKISTVPVPDNTVTLDIPVLREEVNGNSI